MARARNIKPGFFKNEELVELSFDRRLLFIGLWILADREGRLEDRPKRIKMEIFPGDDVNVDKALDDLQGALFIRRYQVGEARYIEVCNFLKHQNPHHREPPSTIPKPEARPRLEQASNSVEPQAHTASQPARASGSPGTGPSPAVLIPDSGSLIPDSGSLIPDSAAHAAREADYPVEFERTFTAYPKRAGDNPKRKALQAWRARLKEGHSAAEIHAGVERYAAFVRATGKENTETVKHAGTFFGLDKPFLEPWALPNGTGGAQSKQAAVEARNAAVVEAALRGDDDAAH